jgi:hypothetical protein
MQYGAVQCGFCIPGQIMTSYALLMRNQDPSEDAIRHALKDTLCRCAGYPTIIGAIQAPPRPCAPASRWKPPGALAAGRARWWAMCTPAPDSVAKVTGSGHLTDDLQFEGMLHARVKRAMVPSAIVRNLDVQRAQALPGVAAVLTAEDIPGEHIHGLVILDWPAWSGWASACAMWAMRSRLWPPKAAKSPSGPRPDRSGIRPAAGVSDPVQARQPGQPQIHEKGNLLKHIKVRKGDPERALPKRMWCWSIPSTPPTDHAFMEPECSIARTPKAAWMLIYVGSQIPYQDRNQVARALGWPEERCASSAS